MLIAIVAPGIDKVIGITGGLLAPILDFAIPMYCYVKLSDNHWTHWKNLSAIIFFSALTMVGFGAVGVITYELVADKDMMPRWKWIGNKG